MKYRDTASFGKRQEYSAIAELLKRGFLCGNVFWAERQLLFHILYREE